MKDTIVVVDPDVVAALDPDGENIERVILENLLLELFRRGEISRGRASELLGLDIAQFMALASSRRIGVVSL